MKIFFIILVIFVFSYQPVSAEQWYDRIPESGEYKPLPEPGTEAVSEDFQSLNEDLDKVNTEGVSSNEEVGAPLDQEIQVVDPEQSGKRSFWLYVSLVFFAILLVSFAYIWWKRNRKKLENNENN